MRAVDAVVWDMDGTLIDSSRVAPAAFADALAAAGLPRPSSATVISAYGLGPPRTILGALLGRPATSSDLVAYHEALTRRAAETVVYPGVREALATIGPVATQAVFTGASAEGAAIMLRAAGLRAHFAIVIDGDQCDRPKPDPEGLLKACAALGVPPERTAYVGDSPLDLQCARRAGCLAVAAGWGHLHDDEPCDVLAVAPDQVTALVT